MTGQPRTRIERVRAAAGIASLALQQIEPDRDGDASCPLHEAAALLTDDAGQRLIWAARALHPQGAI
ncbi:hypothetical protein [Streptomyces sp. PsTaAH-124]|uniref:hypothetical protein n=1 Tax=Streptomyces sp. PsTaAH-124 TaxID=1157638 RepID=UPI00036B74CC|nr:hypothetical protein [Streptomyces sp. PsTaAH-124]